MTTRKIDDHQKNFWSKVLKTKRCWVWTAHKKKNGYGQFYIKRQSVYAHRYSWVISNGSVPENKSVLHKCDNPNCVRPSHLFVVSQRENMLDAVKKGRIKKKKFGDFCSNGHKLSRASTRLVGNKRIVCRLCNIERCSEYYRKNKGGI